MANNQILASDSFLSGSLAPGWVLAPGASAFTNVLVGSPNVTQPVALALNYGQIWTGLSWPNDHASEVTMRTYSDPLNDAVDLLVRFQSGAQSGYLAQIFTNQAKLFSYTTGTGTQIGSTVSLTVSAGDVLTFQAAGSCLTLYQNGGPVASTYDTTWTSGFPGYLQYTQTVPVTTNQISAWRGYNTLQQDGIWAKKGVVIKALAGDISGAGTIGPQNPAIIYDSNAQLLSGNVYKMWFGANPTTGHIGYAESLDGLNWTRRSPDPLIAAGMGLTPSVIKLGATYHLYDGFVTVQPNIVQHWTSSDGITWTQAQANVFSATNLSYFSVVTIIGGTWYALYTLAPGTFPTTTNLATSPDGITWTASGSNPVVNNFWGVVKVFLINGIYYAWGQTTNPHAQEVTFPGVDPGEGLRMQTTNFITWTNPVHSIHHTQQFENVSGVNGGAYCSFPINIGGIAYMYYSGGPNDVVGTPLQIAAAVGPTSLENILLFPEDGTAQTTADAFARGAGGLGPNWITPTGSTALQIISSGVVEPTALTTWCHAIYAGTFPNDQYSELTVTTLAASSYAAPIVRGAAGADTCYEAYGLIGPTGSLNATGVGIGRRIAGSVVLISALVPVTVTVNDVWRLQAQGNILSLFQNGYLIVQVSDNSTSRIASGNPGIGLNASVALANAQLSAFGGGNAGVTPNYPGGGSGDLGPGYDFKFRL